MEADASDVLREEKRRYGLLHGCCMLVQTANSFICFSERIARREDLIEEQKELERLKRRKKANA